MTRREWTLFAAMCVIWGIPYLLIRVAVRDVAPGTLVFLRTAVGGLVLLPVALSRGGFGPLLPRWRALAAFAVVEMAVPWLLLSDAERHLSSSLSGLLISAVPLAGVAIARFTGGERVDRRQLAGLVGGLAGVAMLVGLDLGHVGVSALVEILVVVIGYAVGPVILAQRLADLPGIPVACASLLLVGLGYLPYAALRPPTQLTAGGWLAIATLAVLCTALAFVLFFALIAAIGPARATVITYVNPAVAVLCGVSFLGEDLTLGIALGFPLILAGSILAARRRPVAAVPEAAACEVLEPPSSDQSMRTSPRAVSKTAATSPVPSSDGSQSTSTRSSGC